METRVGDEGNGRENKNGQKKLKEEKVKKMSKRVY